jgi:hypothetical protein
MGLVLLLPRGRESVANISSASWLDEQRKPRSALGWSLPFYREWPVWLRLQ